MSNINPNCDGSHCVRCSEVRVYPLGGGANLILCRACFNHENVYRLGRAGDGRAVDAGQWPVVSWSSAVPYIGAAPADSVVCQCVEPGCAVCDADGELSAKGGPVVPDLLGAAKEVVKSMRWAAMVLEVPASSTFMESLESLMTAIAAAEVVP